MWRAGCNMQGGGSSRAVGSQPTWSDAWFSQGQIHAVFLLELTSASIDIVVPLSLSFVYIPKINFLTVRLEAAVHFPMMSRMPSVSRESKPSQGLGWAPESSPVAIGQNLSPFHKDGKRRLQHPPQSWDHARGWGKESTEPPLGRLLTFRLRVDSEVPPHGPSSARPLGGPQGGDPAAWAGGSWGLLSIAQQPSVKHEGSITDENVAVRLFRHCRIKERLARKSEVLPFGGRHGSEGSKWFCGSSPWGLSKVAVLLIMQFFTGIQKMREFGIFLPALPAFILWQDQPCVNSLSPMVFA